MFIEQLGFSPSLYGLFGVLIAAATLLAARISYKQSRHCSAASVMLTGALCVCIGASLLLMLTACIDTRLNTLRLTLLIGVLFLIFFGIGLVIPNSLSQALKPYQKTAGSAGSLFGGAYYCCVAMCTWIMSVFHSGSFQTLAVYILALGFVTLFGSQMPYFLQMVRKALCSSQKIQQT